MEMELYNTTNKTKVLPKFNYEGKMTMGPHETKKIEDYMAPFYKPYAKVGIVARPITRLGTFNPKDFVEPEVEEVVKENKKPEVKKEEVKKDVKVKESKAEEKVEEPVVEETPESEKEEVVEEPKEDVVEEVPVEEKEEPKKYDKAKLTSMSVKNLKVIAESMGVEITSTKKADIVKAILDFQNK